MKVVPLVSGGLDSTVMSVLIKQQGYEQFPLLINYGQLSFERESAACIANFAAHGLPRPYEIDLSGYGQFFSCGLTDRTKNIVDEAFLPGRNMLFLLCSAAVAFKVDADAVAIGLLNEKLRLFPDQTRKFADLAETLLSEILSRSIQVLTPLIGLYKSEVLAIAKSLGISGTYSCHAGGDQPCGECIACNEFRGLEV